MLDGEKNIKKWNLFAGKHYIVVYPVTTFSSYSKDTNFNHLLFSEFEKY